MHRWMTYDTPTQNRQKISISMDVENTEIMQNMKPAVTDARIALRRPHVSARKPQQCELNTMPINATEFSRPCWYVVNCKSHFAYGMITLTFMFSRPMPRMLRPPAITIYTLNFPCSMQNIDHM